MLYSGLSWNEILAIKCPRRNFKFESMVCTKLWSKSKFVFCLSVTLKFILTCPKIVDETSKNAVMSCENYMHRHTIQEHFCEFLSRPEHKIMKNIWPPTFTTPRAHIYFIHCISEDQTVHHFSTKFLIRPSRKKRGRNKTKIFRSLYRVTLKSNEISILHELKVDISVFVTKLKWLGS